MENTALDPELDSVELLPRWQAWLVLNGIWLAAGLSLLVVIGMLLKLIFFSNYIPEKPGSWDFSAGLPASFIFFYIPIALLGWCPNWTQGFMKGVLREDRGLAMLAWAAAATGGMLCMLVTVATFILLKHYINLEFTVLLGLMIGMFAIAFLLDLPGLVYSRLCVDLDRLKAMAQRTLGIAVRPAVRRVIGRQEDSMIRR